jgi:uncharacterized protein YcfJ
MNSKYVLGGIFAVAAATTIAGVAGFTVLRSGEYAEVISVEPAMTTLSTPQVICRDELVTVKKPVKDEHQVTGTIAGAVIGGVLGHQIGGGKGKDIATVGGAVAGGYAGNKLQEKIQDGNTEQQLQEVCDTVYDRSEVQDGYEVTYRYNDQLHVIHLDHDPGRRIPMENGQPQLDSNS